ncbi:MAG: D-2-hydroxyacid dehydrogenase [Alphaproteobacteria bacterium]|nr:D-2-hydroxyacid dehydrogenase [Alphaproteobacteria bacterium]
MARTVKRPALRLVVAGGLMRGALEQIRASFPRIDAEYCPDGAALCRVVDRLKPTVAFVTKDPVGIKPEHWRYLLDQHELRWLNLGNIGFDHVPAWDRSRLKVTNSGGAAANEMAEFALAAIMMINAGFLHYQARQRTRTWQKHYWTPLSQKTLAVIGAGKIGSHLIKKARALGMRIVAIRASDRKAPGAHVTLPASKLHKGLAQADYVSIQIPLSADTENLIDAAALAHMKPDAWLINIARGAIIDEAALLDALRNGRIGGAVLDALRTEPLPGSSEFWGFDNVVVTSHNSGQIVGFYSMITEMFCENLRRFKAGKRLMNLI